MIGMTAQPGEKQNRQGSRSHAPARIEGKIGHLSDDRFFLCVPVPVWGWVASAANHHSFPFCLLLSPCGGGLHRPSARKTDGRNAVIVPVWGWVASFLHPEKLHRPSGYCPRVGVGCICPRMITTTWLLVAVPVWGWVASVEKIDAREAIELLSPCGGGLHPATERVAL